MPLIAADAARAKEELRDKLSGSVWQYAWRGSVYEFGFGPAGDLLILPSWHDCHWRVTGPDEVTLDGRYGDIMVVKFDRSLRRFECKDWDGSAASGARTGPEVLSLSGLSVQESWRRMYFGITTNTGAAEDAADPDGDGSNFFEFVAGTVPTDPASRFRVRVEAVANQPAQKAIIFGPLAADRIYAVKSKDSLDEAEWMPVTSFSTSDDGNERTVIDLAAGDGPKFYVVEIVLP